LLVLLSSSPPPFLFQRKSVAPSITSVHQKSLSKMSTSSESTSIEVIQGDRSNNASSSSSLAADSKRGKLSFKTKLCYSLGHVYNDMAVSIWFSFTLVFFEHRLPGVWSAALLML